MTRNEYIRYMNYFKMIKEDIVSFKKNFLRDTVVVTMFAQNNAINYRPDDVFVDCIAFQYPEDIDKQIKELLEKYKKCTYEYKKAYEWMQDEINGNNFKTYTLKKKKEILVLTGDALEKAYNNYRSSVDEIEKES